MSSVSGKNKSHIAQFYTRHRQRSIFYRKGDGGHIRLLEVISNISCPCKRRKDRLSEKQIYLRNQSNVKRIPFFKSVSGFQPKASPAFSTNRQLFEISPGRAGYFSRVNNSSGISGRSSFAISYINP